MHCKYCNVEIEDNVKVCPLCHEKLDDYVEGAPTVYPQKDKSIKAKKKSHFTFNNLYWAIALPIFIICAIVDFTTTPGIQWCWLVLILELYGFLFVANTIKSNSSISLKIVLQTIMVFALVAISMWVVSALTPIKPEPLILNYALPLILGIGNVVLFIFSIINVKKIPSLLVDAVFLLLTGYIPIIMYWCKAITLLWPCLVVAIFSIVAHLCCFAFWRGEIKEEIEKKFHL